MKAAELDYQLPPELIAQRPLARRDRSRLLVYERATGAVRHRRFDELPEELAPETLTVVNDTRVLPARLRLERPGGGEAEVLLLERVGQNGLWEGLARPSRKLRAGQRLGPVSVDDLAEHELHSERYEVSAEAWERIRAASRVLTVGTTTVRVLESLARGAPLAGRTELFVVPGFEFRRVDALLTNFHLPRSTLLALVMAFAGIDETRELYRLAIAERYRFYSFGDAMLIL